MKVIVLSTEGQTCNKFWIWSRFFADAMANHQKIYILVPDITIEDYPNLLNSSVVKFPLYKKSLIKFFGRKKYLQLLNKIFINRISISAFKILFSVIPNVSFTHASIAGKRNENKEQYFEELSYLFTPSKSILKRCQSIIDEIRTKHEIIIGLHIRYGDYRNYLDGKYFYEVTQYRAKIEELISEFEQNKTFAIFIASNENIDIEIFNGLNVFTLKNSDATSDLYMLSQCDLIIGPPSTYSGWASFYGQKPIYFIENINRKISINDFQNILRIWEG